VIEVPGEALFRHYWLKSIPGAGVFEAYVNRDALPYMEKYGLENAAGMYRGTLRNIGYCETWNSLKRLDLLNRNRYFDFDQVTPREVLSSIVNRGEEDIRSAVSAFLNVPVHSLILKKMEWLGLFSRRKLPLGNASLFDMLAHMLKTQLVFDEGERDLLIMHHEFEVKYPDLPTKRIQSTLIDRGIPEGHTSMARTVGYPVGIAASLIAKGRIDLKGVRIPVLPEFYDPILAECERFDIHFVERISDLDTDERSYWGD
jgi:saccharopine dehydrogenase-like NADP-dependent oxidoreductase